MRRIEWYIQNKNWMFRTSSFGHFFKNFAPFFSEFAQYFIICSIFHNLLVFSSLFLYYFRLIIFFVLFLTKIKIQFIRDIDLIVIFLETSFSEDYGNIFFNWVLYKKNWWQCFKMGPPKKWINNPWFFLLANTYSA